MGLDMYLERMPRYGNTTPTEVNTLCSYFTWKKEKEIPGHKAKQYTFEKWTGIPYKDVPTGKVRKFYKQHHRMEPWKWDKEQQFGLHGKLSEEIGYWRKANHIHNWFVENVQEGVDDCEYHDEVTKETLEELRDICKKVLDSCEMVDAKINVGTSFKNGGATPILEDGQIVKDSSIAEELLPCCSGFFFGGTEYDNYYVDSLHYTIEIIDKALATTDFEKQMIYYVSSW